MADTFLEDYAQTIDAASERLKDIARVLLDKREVDFNKQKAKQTLKQLKIVLGLLKSNFRLARETKMDNRKVAVELLKIAKELTARVTEQDIERMVMSEGGNVSRILQFLANIKMEEAEDWNKHYGPSKAAQAHYRVAKAIGSVAREVSLIESGWKDIWEEFLEQESA